MRTLWSGARTSSSAAAPGAAGGPASMPATQVWAAPSGPRIEAWWASTAAMTARASSAVAAACCAWSGAARSATPSKAALILIAIRILILILIGRQVTRNLGIAQQAVDMAAFLEALVEQEFELRGIFGV